MRVRRKDEMARNQMSLKKKRIKEMKRKRKRKKRIPVRI